MQWYWIDIAIISVLGLSVITGLFRGFIKEVIALSLWIFAFWFAFHYGTMLDPWINPYIHEQTAKTIVEFIIILFVTLLLGGLVNLFIGFIVRRSGLSGMDRLLGMAFGFIRGVFIVAIIMVGIRLSGISDTEYNHRSALYSKFDPLVQWLSGYVPEFIHRVNVLDSTQKAHQ